MSLKNPVLQLLTKTTSFVHEAKLIASDQDEELVICYPWKSQVFGNLHLMPSCREK